jgi:hypothetical protein
MIGTRHTDAQDRHIMNGFNTSMPDRGSMAMALTGSEQTVLASKVASTNIRQTTFAGVTCPAPVSKNVDRRTVLRVSLVF